MVGAIIGDVVGSRFEFRNTDKKDFTFLTDKCYFTDDTVMTCAVAYTLLSCQGDWSKLTLDFAAAHIREIGKKYPFCGYGARFITWVLRDPTPYNSFGNGSAMRVSPVGFVAETEEEVKDLSYKVTAISHNHEEGLKGAECTAMCIFLARKGKTKEEIMDYVVKNYGYDLSTTVDEYRKNNDGMHGKEICQVSVPQALRSFMEGTDYEDVIRNCISMGGDSDTIAAIAGGIAQAYYGVPEKWQKDVRTYLDDELKGILDEFEEKYMH